MFFSPLLFISELQCDLQVSLVLPTLEDKAGLGATYLLFAGIGVVSLGSIYATIPETKGKTLEEIEALWAEDDKGN